MDENIKCTIEALIMSSPEPIPVQRLCETIGKISPREVREAVADLNNLYMGCGNSFRIREIAGGYQMYILPDFEGQVKKLLEKQRTIRLTRAALEALAIVAYKQPVTKSEIEHIRGVASDGVLYNLLQRDLIAIAGRADAPGRPLLYKTSKEFLKFFGLNRISDLPSMEEIEEMIRQEEPPESQTVFQFSEAGSLKAIGKADTPDEPLDEALGKDDTPVLADIEAGKTIMLESVLRDDDGNGNGGNGDRDGYPVLDDYEPIPGDPVPLLNRDEASHSPDATGKIDPESDKERDDRSEAADQ